MWTAMKPENVEGPNAHALQQRQYEAHPAISARDGQKVPYGDSSYEPEHQQVRVRTLEDPPPTAPSQAPYVPYV